MRSLEVLVLVIALCHEWCHSETVETKTLRLCISQNSCENCLEASLSCAWCSDWSYTNSSHGKPRCNVPERLKDFGCPPEEIRTAHPGSVTLVEDFNFKDVEVADEIPVQLRPQKVKAKIRPNSKTVIQLRYRPAKNYPLDLYYLMDLTWSMKDDKDTLVSLGWNMTNTLERFTNKFRLGFGTYADKPLMPFVFPGHEENPCKSALAECSPLYIKEVYVDYFKL
ncbi:Integrin beta-nu [Dufourea novaeangliae]|uniref:Integrin beta n=1 Tax=Dufourea novaeangliae TaxID=178035 RepID=A0A154P2N7_DUFNO|nr:Integrin beta-nu [Dufourea novaeangliae]